MSDLGAHRAVVALSSRLVRRGALLLAAFGASYVALEIVSYEQTYPTAESRARLADFQDNPAVRMLQGLARDLDTTGGFVAWDGGWFLQTVAAIWVLLAVLRVTRADEESDRCSLLLVAPLPARRVLALQLLVAVAAGALFSAACVVVLVAWGVPPGGAGLFGVGLACFVATAAGLAGVIAQLFDVRRRAVGVASAVLAGCYLLRMVGNSTDQWAWLRWTTPYGWVDELQPYGDTSWTALGLLLLTPVVLVTVACSLRGARDTGGAVLASDARRTARTRLLGSSLAFTWRCGRGALLAWGVGLAAYAALIGSLLPTLVDYLLDDPQLRTTLGSYGIDVSDVSDGMVGFMSSLFGLAFALFACWRLGAARAEEESARLDHLFARPLSRARWVGGHVLVAGAGVVVLATTTGTSMWAGGRLAGAELSLGAAVGATWSTVPVAFLLAAVAVLLFATLPRVTVVGSASVSAVAYLLPALGQGVGLPLWVRDVSPFQHLAVVPVEPYAVTAGLLMLGLASVVTAAGMVLLARRDLAGA
ncbi:MAG: hypothetical protein Q8R60_05950 [Mycobacteriales bacterium]|nr:hypothetical protein [Mycobacteriales bacterium]